MVQPNGMADNFGGETKTPIAGYWVFHHTSLSNRGQLDKTKGIAQRGLGGQKNYALEIRQLGI